MGKYTLVPTQELRELLVYYDSLVESLTRQSQEATTKAERDAGKAALKEARSDKAGIIKALRFRKTLPNPPSSSGPPDIHC